MLLCVVSFCAFCLLKSVLHQPIEDMVRQTLLDLVPVSSTVIPLPSYQVGYGLNVSNPNKYFKNSQLSGTKLITDQDVKKYYYGEKKQQQKEKKETSESALQTKIQASR